MNFLRLLPVFLATLVFAAHFMRMGMLPVSVLVLLLPFSLLIKKPWSARVVQVFLVLASLEWIRSAVVQINFRISISQPWHRLAIILGVVAILTASAALVFRSGALRLRYGLGDDPQSPDA